MEVFVYRALSGELLLHTDPKLDGVGGWGQLVGRVKMDIYDMGPGSASFPIKEWPPVPDPKEIH